MSMIRKPFLFLVAVFSLVTAVAPKVSMADTIEVRVTLSDPACSQPSCFTTIQGAINYVDSIVNTPTGTTNIYNIRVESGTYNEAITLKPRIPIIQGREAAKTILKGAGSGAVFTSSGITGASIMNFTIQNAAVGIDASNSSTLTISNMIFNVGTTGTAVNINTSPGVSVINNVFFQNGIAISSTANVPVTNNIFAFNTTALMTNLNGFQFSARFNDFFSNGAIGSIVSDPSNTTFDPLFVDTVNNDFHLLPGSPCINQGDPSFPNKFNPPTVTSSDMGAYGGPGVDLIPFQVSGVTAAVPASTTISLSWNQNKSYLTKGYLVHYGTASGVYNGTVAAEGPSPLFVTSGTSTTLSGLPASTITPSAPVLQPPTVLNQSLGLSWSAVSGATSYRIYYGTTSPPSTIKDVGNVTSDTLTGLTNGQTYFVQVTAISQTIFYMAVTAVDNSTGPYKPGIQDESMYSAEVQEAIGTPNESARSNIETSFPEMLVPYPNLPHGNQGCFIATAAYGDYSSPEVRILREFRDKYLLTSELGYAFVRWYYLHSPAAAAYLNAHPRWKPLARAALAPAVGAAFFMTRTSLPLKIGLFMLAGCAIVFLVYRKRISGSGGDH